MCKYIRLKVFHENFESCCHNKIELNINDLIKKITSKSLGNNINNYNSNKCIIQTSSSLIIRAYDKYLFYYFT